MLDNQQNSNKEGIMGYDSLFPKPGGGSPSPAGPATPAGPAAPGGGLPGEGGQPGTTPPSAQAIIDQFVQYAKSEGIPPEEVVEMIMEAIIAAGYTPPPEEKVAELVNASYKGTPSSVPGQTPGGPGGAPTAPPAGSPGGGASLPLQ